MDSQSYVILATSILTNLVTIIVLILQIRQANKSNELKFMETLLQNIFKERPHADIKAARSTMDGNTYSDVFLRCQSIQCLGKLEYNKEIWRPILRAYLEKLGEYPMRARSKGGKVTLDERLETAKAIASALRISIDADFVKAYALSAMTEEDDKRDD